MSPDPLGAPDRPGRSASDGLRDAGGLSAYLAGLVGQASLDQLTGVAHPELGQHVAAVRDAVAGAGWPRPTSSGLMLGALVRYASGFVDAAIGHGWIPPGTAAEPPDWQSMRLAAVCYLVSETGEDPGRQAALPG